MERWSAMRTFIEWLNEEMQFVYDTPAGAKWGSDPSWMTPEKKNILKQTYAAEPRKGVHQIKAWWNQVVDRNFIQSVTTVHYGHADRIDKELQAHIEELSCIGYLNPPYKNGWMGDCGIIVKGHVTLAGNGDLQTNQWMGSSSRGERRKWSEYYRDFITNKENFIPPKLGSHNEFLVANWKPVAVIKSSKNSNAEMIDQYNTMTPEQLAQKYNLSLLDESGRVISSQLQIR